MKLTKRAIDAMSYEGDGISRDVRWDSEIPGFGVRVYPSGEKSFVLSYRVGGRKRLMVIKDQRILTVDEARARARKHLANLDEVDPLESRRRLAQGKTVKELCDAYLERYAIPRKQSWKADERRINSHIIPPWGNLKAAGILGADVAALHSSIGQQRPYEANRTVELISKMFELARIWGFVPDNHLNPARDIEHFKEQKRDRWVTPEELPKLAEAIDEESNRYARCALWLYLLTGARKSELLTAKWVDVDWTREELRLPKTKAGRVHYIPLSGPALALLQDIPRIKNNPYIFPGLKPGSHLVNIDKPWRRVRDRATVKLWANHSGDVAALVAELTQTLGREPTRQEVEQEAKKVKQAAIIELPKGIKDVRLHDLRRTVGSWLAQSGNTLHLIGRVLNHSNQSTTAIYARFGQDQVRQALESHADRLLGVAQKKPPAEIVKLKK